MASGAAAERARISAIVSLDEAKGREASALKIALSTGMSPSEAAAVLATLPTASPQFHGQRSKDSPIGLTMMDDTDRPGASEFLSPAEVAAKVNSETAP